MGNWLRELAAYDNIVKSFNKAERVPNLLF